MNQLQNHMHMFTKTEVYKQTFNEDSAPGMVAINKKEYELYAGKDLTQWATIIPHEIGGEDPLKTVDCFISEKQQTHLHYITLGFTNLFYDPDFAEDKISGYGFELTFRHLPLTGDTDKPQWPATLLQNIAKYVFSTGNVFDDYHYMPANGPLRLETNSDITAIIFFTDPEMQQIDTPHGRVKFLQVFGITTKEYNEIMQEKQTAEGLVEKHRKINPLLITDLNRK